MVRMHARRHVRPDADQAPTTDELRRYQKAAASSVEVDQLQSGRALLVLATGLRQTVVGEEVIQRLLAGPPDDRVLVLAHMKELVEHKTLPTQVLTGDHRPGSFEGVTVAVIDSVLGLVRTGWRPTMIMVDETAHVGETGMFPQLLDLYDDAQQFGVTATFWRGDNSTFCLPLRRASLWILRAGVKGL